MSAPSIWDAEQLLEENQGLRSENERLRAQVARLQKQAVDFVHELQAVQARERELEEQLAQATGTRP